MESRELWKQLDRVKKIMGKVAGNQLKVFQQRHGVGELHAWISNPRKTRRSIKVVPE